MDATVWKQCWKYLHFVEWHFVTLIIWIVGQDLNRCIGKIVTKVATLGTTLLLPFTRYAYFNQETALWISKTNRNDRLSKTFVLRIRKAFPEKRKLFLLWWDLKLLFSGVECLSRRRKPTVKRIKPEQPKLAFTICRAWNAKRYIVQTQSVT